MPIINEENLRKMLKSEITDNIFFIFGSDDYLKEFYCSKLISLFVDDTLKFFNFHSYQDNETELEKIFADAENLPVMAEKTCLLIKNYSLSDMNAKQLQLFEEQLGGIPDSTVMIFYFSAAASPGLNKKNTKEKSLISIAAKYGIAAKIDRRTRADIAKMLIRKAGENGCELERETASYFIDCTGEDMQTIVNEFGKLCSFADGKKITKEMIDLITIKSVEASVFDISAAIFSGHTDKAFSAVNELLRQKTPLQSIIGALAGAYVNIYRYKLALNSGRSISDFAPQFGYSDNSSYIFSKLSAFTRKSSLSSIRRAIDIIAQADVRSKSTKSDDMLLLSELIAKLAETAREE